MGGPLTINAFAKLDNLPKRHRFPVLRSEMGQDTGTKGDLLVEVALGEAIAAELELGRVRRVQIGVKNAEGIQVRNVVTAHLVGANKELHLKHQ